MSLKQDNGNYYRDKNAARFPEYALEPAVESIFQTNPLFDTSSIDVFACGSTLGDRLRFCMGKSEHFSVTILPDLTQGR